MEYINVINVNIMAESKAKEANRPKPENMATAERIKLLQVKLHISTIKQFAEEIGVPIATFTKKASGVQKLGTEQAIAIVERFPNVSLSWLLLGHGRMFLGDSDDETSQKTRVKADVLEVENGILKKRIERQTKEIEDLNKLLDEKSKQLDILLS